MRVGVRIEDRDAEPVLAVGRQDQRKGLAPQALQARRQAEVRPVGERLDRLPLRRERRCERADRSRRSAHDVRNALALDGGDRRERAHLAQRLHRAERQIEPGRIGAVDDVDVVVARQMSVRAASSGDAARMSKNSAHSADVPASVMSPVMRTRSSGRRRACAARRARARSKPLVAARAGAAALDPEPVALADDMDVREMGDAPDARRPAAPRRTPRGRAAGRRARRRSPRRARRPRDRPT